MSRVRVPSPALSLKVDFGVAARAVGQAIEHIQRHDGFALFQTNAQANYHVQVARGQDVLQVEAVGNGMLKGR